MPATLVVLAGGGSRRMGRPKALLPVGGTTLLDQVVDRLAPAFDELLIATHLDLPGRLVRDRLPGAGPLAGIEAGLAAASNEVVFAVACDMPYVTPELAGRLVAASKGFDAAVPRAARRAEPACAAYRRSALPIVTAALDDGVRRAADALARLRVNWIEDVDPAELVSLNTPADWERFVAASSRGGP